MTCAGCDKHLEKREHAQPMMVMGQRCWPRSFCDACCKANPFPHGTPEALERLVAGQVDAAEAKRVGRVTDEWAAPFAAVLESATVLEGAL